LPLFAFDCPIGSIPFFSNPVTVDGKTYDEYQTTDPGMSLRLRTSGRRLADITTYRWSSGAHSYSPAHSWDYGSIRVLISAA
jgi:hypothetical protein